MELTPTEQRIYRNFYRQKIFSLEEVIKFLKNNYRASLISTKNLVSKKYVKKIRRGLYYIIPFEKTGKWFTGFEPNKYLIANALVDGYISHNAALEIHGVTEKHTQNAHICSSTKIPDVKVDSYKFYVVKTKHYFGFIDVMFEDTKIRVSDVERTIIDCLRNVNYTTGIEDLLEAIAKFESVDFEKLFEYLRKVNEVSLYSRVGYAMDFLKFKLKTPDWFRAKVGKKLSDRTYYLDASRKGSSRHVKEWKLMVPEDVLKLNV